MHTVRSLLLCAVLVSLPALAVLAAPQAPPLCRVLARVSPWPGGQRLLRVHLRPGCPPGGIARLQLRSALGGSLPDNPPGEYTLQRGEILRRLTLPWWHLVWLDASGRAWRVPEEP